MHAPRLIPAALLLLAGVFVSVSHAAWPDDRYIDMGGTGGAIEATLLPTNVPNEYWAGYYYIGGGAWAWQRFTTDGFPNWSGGATRLFGEYGGDHSWQLGTAYVPDQLGGLFHAYFTNGTGSPGRALRLQHIDAMGALTPPLNAHPTNWRLDTLTTWTSVLPAGAPTGDGGAYFVWDRGGLRMTRVDATGAVVAPWPDRGWRIPGTTSPSSLFMPPAAASDGAGGLLLLWVDDSVRVQRVDADAALHAGWPGTGLALRAPVASMIENSLTLLRSDASHFLALWSEGGTSRNIVCQRFALDGTRDPAWPAGGLVLAGPFADDGSFRHLFRVLADGNGGAIVGWPQGDDYRVSIVRVDGSQPFAITTVTRSEIFGNTGRALKVGLASGPDGGHCVFWRSVNGGVRGRWFDANGQPYPSFGPHDVEVRSEAEMALTPFQVTVVRAAIADGQGGAYVLCEGNGPSSNPPTGSAILMHASHRGVTGVVPSRPASFALSRPAPNPARPGEGMSMRFTVPTTGHVRVRVHDVAGRAVRTLFDDGLMQAMGPGLSPITLPLHWDGRGADGRAATPGLYFVRAEFDGRIATERIALVK